MLIVLLGIILGVICAFCLINSGWPWDLADYFGFIAVSAFFCGLGLILSILVASGIGLFFKQTLVQTDTYQLVSMRDAIGIQGNFFLGFGSVSDNPKYYFYKKLPNNGYKLQSLDADNVTIYQDDDKAPHVKVYGYDFKNKYIQWFALPKGAWYSIYDVHIPANSIKQDFNLNLGK